jgi:ATP-dependent Lon protease
VSRYVPVFPLGNALLPTQVMPLHIFEPRYRALMDVLHAPDSARQIGVVLIERGREVGGGDVRVDVGTIAHLVESERLPDGRWLAVFVARERFRVATWLPDDPFPQAEIDELQDPQWDPGDEDRLRDAEGEVRRALTLAAELGETRVPSSFELPSDPAAAAWILAAAAPIGSFDRQQLLEAPSASARLDLLLALVRDASRVLAFRLYGR